MRTKTRRTIITAAFFSLILLFSCSTENSGKITINAGSSNRAVFNSSDIGSIQVTVSARDMTTVTETFSYEDSISLEVPPGTNREISLVVQVTPGSLTPVREYRGAALIDVVEGENSVNIPLSITRSAIVIPDYQNSRFVMIDSMSPTESGWNTINDGDLTLVNAADLKPYDVEMSKNGDIYFINNGSTTDTTLLVRLGRFDNSAATVLSIDNGTYNSMALDETNRKIYISLNGGAQVKVVPLDADNMTEIPTTDLDADIQDFEYSTISLTCDPDGNLYVLNPTYPRLSKLDMSKPEGSRLIFKTSNSVPVGETSPPTPDIMFKNGYIWLANNSSSGSTVTIYDTDLNVVGSFGTQTTEYTSPPALGFFGADSSYGSIKFLSFIGDEMIVMDENGEDGLGNNYDRLISFSDDSGSDWQTFGQNGTAADSFGYFDGLVHVNQVK